MPQGRGTLAGKSDEVVVEAKPRRTESKVCSRPFTLTFIEGTLKLRVNCSKSASFVLRSPNFSDIRSWERQGRRVSLRRALHDLCTSSSRSCVEAAEDPSWERSRP